MKYYMTRRVSTDYEDTLKKVEEQLKLEGFGVLTEIDVKGTLKKKIDVDFRRYKILGACNPHFAYEAFKLEDKIGVLLPCNVIVQEHGEDDVEVSAVNPNVAMETVKNKEMEKVSDVITKKLSKVLESL